MDSFIVVGGNIEDKISTEFEYDIDEILTLNSTFKIRCFRKKIVNNELLQFFVSCKGNTDSDYYTP